MASTPVQARIDADAPDQRQVRAPLAGASFCCSSPSIGRPEINGAMRTDVIAAP